MDICISPSHCCGFLYECDPTTPRDSRSLVTCLLLTLDCNCSQLPNVHSNNIQSQIWGRCDMKIHVARLQGISWVKIFISSKKLSNCLLYQNLKKHYWSRKRSRNQKFTYFGLSSYIERHLACKLYHDVATNTPKSNAARHDKETWRLRRDVKNRLSPKWFV